MTILKFEPRTPRTLADMVAYMSDPAKTRTDSMFGLGVNPKNAALEMQFLQDLYKREDMEHPYVQVILSFQSNVHKDMETLWEICVRIGQILINDRRQVFGAIHYINEKNIHCHYLINYVGIDGSLYRQIYSVEYYKALANKILAEYGLDMIK